MKPHNKQLTIIKYGKRGIWTFLLRGKSVLFVSAVWINDQHIWSGTGAQGDEQTLHNLVCHAQPEGSGCVNPQERVRVDRCIQIRTLGKRELKRLNNL